MTGRYWRVLAGVSAGAFLVAGCSSAGTTSAPASASASARSASVSASAASVSASASSASASARAMPSARAGNAVSSCYARRAAGAILVRTTATGKAAATRQVSGQWVWDTAASTCKTAVQMAVASAPKGAGDCTRVAYASRNPGYKTAATPSAPLRHVVASAGPAC